MVNSSQVSQVPHGDLPPAQLVVVLRWEMNWSATDRSWLRIRVEQPAGYRVPGVSSAPAWSSWTRISWFMHSANCPPPMSKYSMPSGMPGRAPSDMASPSAARMV